MTPARHEHTLASTCFASLAAGEPPIAVATSLVAGLPSDVQAAVSVVCAALQQTDHALVSQVLTLALHRALGRSGWSTALAARSLLGALPMGLLSPPPRLWELCVCVCGALAELPLAECSGEERLRALRLALSVLHMPAHRAATTAPSATATATSPSVLVRPSHDGAKRAKTLPHLPARGIALRRAAARLLLALIEPRRADGGDGGGGGAAPAVTVYAALVAQRRVLRATALEAAPSISPLTSSSASSSSSAAAASLPAFLLPPTPLAVEAEGAAAEGAAASLALAAMARRQAALSEALRAGFAPTAASASASAGGEDEGRAWHWVCPLLAATQPAGAPQCAWGQPPRPAALLLPPSEARRGAAWQSSVDLVGRLISGWAPPKVVLLACEEAAAAAAEAEAEVAEAERGGTQGGAQGGAHGGVASGRSELGRAILYAAMLREIEREIERHREIEIEAEQEREQEREQLQLRQTERQTERQTAGGGAAAAGGAGEAEEAAAAVELLSGYWDTWHPLLDTLYALCAESKGGLRLSLPPLFAALQARGVRHNVLPHLLCACYHRWENPPQRQQQQPSPTQLYEQVLHASRRT